MCYREKDVLDYNQCFVACDINHTIFDEPSPIEIQPLTPDLCELSNAIRHEYTMARGDVLEITVFGEEDLRVENAVIAPDGKVYFSVLDGIPAAGRNPSEVAKEIEAKLNHLMVHPLVTVIPKTISTQNFKVLGRVRRPGIYPIIGPTRLRNAICYAGGLVSQAEKNATLGDYNLATSFYSLKNSFIVRGNRKLDIDFDKLLLSGNEEQNIFIHPEDYIYIASTDVKNIFVLGAMVLPQRLPFIPGITLTAALSSAGGWPTPGPYSPDWKRILVIRNALNRPCVVQVDLRLVMQGKARDVILQPGDLVYAQHKQMRLGRELVRIAIESFVNSFMIDIGEYYGGLTITPSSTTTTTTTTTSGSTSGGSP